MANLCGLDWRTATHKEMDECKAWFVCTCKRCAESETKKIRSWRCVVSPATHAFIYSRYER